MKKAGRRVMRAAAACTLVGALSVGALVGQASAVNLSSYTAKGDAFALKVSVDLSALWTDANLAPVGAAIDGAYSTARAAVPANELVKLPETFPRVIEETFLKTSSEATNKVTKAVSHLGDGFIDLPKTQATSVGEDNSVPSQTVSFPPVADAVDLSTITANVGNLTAKVTEGPLVNASSDLASLTADLANLVEFMPPEVVAVLDTALATVNTAVNDATSQLNQALDDVEVQVEDLLGLGGSAVAGTPLEDVLADVGTDIPDVEIPDVPNPLTTRLADVQALKSSSISQKTADGRMISESISQIASINVLDGFFSADLIDLKSHSQTAGVAGSALNSHACTIGNARLGDLAGVALDGRSIYVTVNGEPVAVPVDTAQVADVKSQIDSLLAAAGISIALCDAANGSTAADGSAASQSVSAFRIEIAPKVSAVTDLLGVSLPAGSDLGIKLVIDPTVTSAVGAAPAAVAAAPAAQLPRTGAGALATIVSGLVLTSGAILMRRRVR